MNWEQKSPWHWERACGRYCISRSLSFDGPKDHIGSWKYYAWRKASPAAIAIGDRCDDFESAVRLCAADITQRQQSGASTTQGA